MMQWLQSLNKKNWQQNQSRSDTLNLSTRSVGFPLGMSTVLSGIDCLKGAQTSALGSRIPQKEKVNRSRIVPGTQLIKNAFSHVIWLVEGYFFLYGIGFRPHLHTVRRLPRNHTAPAHSEPASTPSKQSGLGNADNATAWYAAARGSSRCVFTLIARSSCGGFIHFPSSKGSSPLSCVISNLSSHYQFSSITTTALYQRSTYLT